jgi:hypothetical protein
MADRVYGYLKSTLAKAALFSIVTNTLLHIHTFYQYVVIITPNTSLSRTADLLGHPEEQPQGLALHGDVVFGLQVDGRGGGTSGRAGDELCLLGRGQVAAVQAVSLRHVGQFDVSVVGHDSALNAERTNTNMTTDWHCTLEQCGAVQYCDVGSMNVNHRWP